MSSTWNAKNRSEFRSIALQNLVATAYISLLAPMATNISKTFSVNIADVGLVNALFLLISGGVSLIWAINSDRSERKKLLLISSMIWIISCFLTIFTINFTMLIILQIIGAIGFGGVLPISYSLIIDLTIPEKRSYALGVLQTCITLGAGLGFLHGGILIAYFPWWVPFLFISILGIINFIFLLRIKEPSKGSLDDYNIETLIIRINRKDFKEISKIKSNYILILFVFMKSISVGAINFYFIAMLEIDHGFSSSIATIMMICIFSIMIVGSPVLGKLADSQYKKRRTGKIDVIIILLIIGPIFYILGFSLIFDSTQFDLIILFFILILIGAFFMSGDYPIQQSVLSDVDPPQIRSTVFSILYIASYIGQSIGVLLLGYLYFLNGKSFIMGYIIICLILMSSIIFLFPLRKTVITDLEYLKLKYKMKI
ncbi:MAG: MFS transporter [Promethearchaeota archaeon]